MFLVEEEKQVLTSQPQLLYTEYTTIGSTQDVDHSIWQQMF